MTPKRPEPDRLRTPAWELPSRTELLLWAILILVIIGWFV